MGLLEDGPADAEGLLEGGPPGTGTAVRCGGPVVGGNPPLVGKEGRPGGGLGRGELCARAVE
eukprot:14236546-Heterocapsa_arctica.AAC.1